MLRTVILGGLLYCYYVSGHVGWLLGAFATMHIIQESIIGVVKGGMDAGETALQQMRGGAASDERQDETKTH